MHFCKIEAWVVWIQPRHQEVAKPAREHSTSSRLGCSHLLIQTTYHASFCIVFRNKHASMPFMLNVMFFALFNLSQYDLYNYQSQIRSSSTLVSKSLMLRRLN